MLKTINSTGLSSIYQSLIDALDKDEVNENGGNKPNSLNPSASKKSIRTGNLTFEGAKKGGRNIKKDVKAASGSNHVTQDAKKAFNYLQYVFIKALILQYFDLE